MAKENSNKGIFGFVYGLIGLATDWKVNSYHQKHKKLGWLIKAMESCSDIPEDLKKEYLAELKKDKTVIEDFPNTLVNIRLWSSWVPAFFAVLSFRYHSLAFLIVSIIFIVGLAGTDALDGRIARKLGVDNRPWGKKWDPIADKALTIITVFALSALVLVTSRIQFWWKIPVIAIALFYILVEIRLFYLANYYLPKERGKAEGLGKRKVAGANNFGKIKFTFVFLTILVLLICFFLVEIGSMTQFSFVALAIVLLATSSVLGLISAYKRSKGV